MFYSREAYTFTVSVHMWSWCTEQGNQHCKYGWWLDTQNNRFYVCAKNDFNTEMLSYLTSEVVI